MNTIAPEAYQDKRQFWIILFIYLSIFINSYVFFFVPFEFYFGYLIYILLLPVFILRYGFNQQLLGIFSILLFTGLLQIFFGNNTAELFFKVFTGLCLSYFFYYYVILEFDYNVEQLFKWYLKGSYVAAIIGLVQFFSFQVGFTAGYNYRWIFNKWNIAPGGIFGIRINSIFAEPTHLGAVLSAAFFISLYNLFRREGFYLSKFQSAVIVAVYLLSFSGLGQGGIFLSLLFLAISFGLVRYIFVAIPVAILLFNVLYNNVKDFKERYDSLTSLFSGEKFVLGKTHGSAFVLYNNFNVAMENFKGNFLFGSGIGSHPVAFDKYSMAKNIKVYGFNLNSADANSMLLRLISETGLFGVILIFVIVFKCYVKRDPDRDTYHWLISNSIIIMILLNLFRQGHYFLNGFPFFLILYYFNSISYKNYLEENNLLSEEKK
jgi:hypothetical protein